MHKFSSDRIANTLFSSLVPSAAQRGRLTNCSESSPRREELVLIKRGLFYGNGELQKIQWNTEMASLIAAGLEGRSFMGPDQQTIRRNENLNAVNKISALIINRPRKVWSY